MVVDTALGRIPEVDKADAGTAAITPDRDQIATPLRTHLPQPVEFGPNPPGGGIDRAAIERFLTELHAGAPGLLQTVRAEGSGNQKTFYPRFHGTDEDGIEEATTRLLNAGKLPAGVSLYTQVTTCMENPNDDQPEFGQFGRKRGGVANTSHLLCLWDDLDYGTDGHAEAKCDRLPNPPDAETAHEIYVRAGLADASIIVNSGGGLYHIVKLDEPFDMTVPGARRRAESVSKRWQQLIEKTAREMGYHYGAGVSNLDRLLRVPGTVNTKIWDRLRRATAQYSGVRYSFAELEELINDLYPEPAAPARSDGTAYQVDRCAGAGAELPGNDFNARGDWQRDILDPAELTYSHSCGEVTYWCRPGKEPRDGHGFSLNHKPDLLFAWTDGTPLTPQRYYDKFSAFTHLFHGGDFKAAAQALRSLGYGAKHSAVREGQAVTATIPEQAGEEDFHYSYNPETGISTKVPGRLASDIAEEERLKHLEEAEQEKRAPKDPIPLEAPYPEPYNPDCFGHLGTVSRAVSDSFEVPTDMPLMAFIGCVSTAIGGRVVVEVRDGYEEHVTHYGITQALPGRRKGTPQKWAKRPLDAWAKTRVEANRMEVLKDASMRKALDQRVMEAEKAVAKAGPKDTNAMADLTKALQDREDLGDPKAHCQLFTDNTTAEALAMDMYPQGQRIAVLSSESVFLSNLGGRYSRGEPNIDLVLKAFSQEPDTGSRVGRDVPQLDRPNLTISLAIQDDAISHLGKASLMMDERGLWGRMMWCVPRDMAGIRQYDVPSIPQDVTDEYDRRITTLLNKVYVRDAPMRMTLSDDAVIEFRVFYSQTDPKLYGPLERVPFHGWQEKAAGLVLRTAALVTLYEHALDDELPTEIPADIFKAVASQQPVMMAHARKAASFMTINEEDPLEPARRILQWISTRAQSPVIKVRDILRAFGKDPRFPRMSAVVEALDVLEERGWIFYGQTEDGGSDKNIIRAHPAAVPHLADDEAYQAALVTSMNAEEAEEKADAREVAVLALAQALDPFVKRFCVTGDDKTHTVPKADLWAAWESFSSQEVEQQYFTQALKKVCPQVSEKRLGKKKVQSYVGITLG